MSLINANRTEYKKIEMRQNKMEGGAAMRYELRVRNIAYQLVLGRRFEYRNRWAQYAAILTHPCMDESDYIAATEMYDPPLQENKHGAKRLHVGREYQ